MAPGLIGPPWAGTSRQVGEAIRSPTQKSDTYWTGKALGRAARIAEIADQVGDSPPGTRPSASIRTTLTDWFTASPENRRRSFTTTRTGER